MSAQLPSGVRRYHLPGDHAREIVREIGRKHGVGLAEIMGPGRTDRVCLARNEAIAALYATGRYSLPALGEFLNRHPDSIRHSIKSHEFQLLHGGPVIRSTPVREQPRTRLEALASRLAQQYDPERVAAIMADKDPATNRDIADWRSFGR